MRFIWNKEKYNHFGSITLKVRWSRSWENRVQIVFRYSLSFADSWRKGERGYFLCLFLKQITADRSNFGLISLDKPTFNTFLCGVLETLKSEEHKRHRVNKTPQGGEMVPDRGAEKLHQLNHRWWSKSCTSPRNWESCYGQERPCLLRHAVLIANVCLHYLSIFMTFLIIFRCIIFTWVYSEKSLLQLSYFAGEFCSIWGYETIAGQAVGKPPCRTPGKRELFLIRAQGSAFALWGRTGN